MKGSVRLVSVAAVAAITATLAGPAAAAGPATAERGGRERAPALPGPVEPGPGQSAPGELLVRFDVARLGAAPERGIERALDAVGGRVVRGLDDAVPGLRRVAVKPGTSVPDAVARLEARPDVLYTEPNYLTRAAAVPNDSRFPELWGLHNTGQQVKGVAGAVDADIDAPEAWDVTTGSSAVTVAVLDTGVVFDHPDLAPNMWVNSREVAGNGLDDDGNGFVDDRRGWDAVAGDGDPSDEQGHGTHVAGTIGARGGNDVPGAGPTDVTGVAWTVGLMPVRVLDHLGNGTYADLIEGIGYARRNGARVANLSLSGWDSSQALYDAVSSATAVTFVVAAGNDGHDIDSYWPIYPCMFDLANVLCVAASDSRDRLAGFSNYGATSVDVAAPGVSTLSTAAYARRFSDTFETDTGRWVTGGSPDTWARTTNVPLGATGTWLTDSPDGYYPNSSDNWARTAALDLTGRRDCHVKFYGLSDTESWWDFFSVEAATSTSGPWTQLGRWSGFLDGAFDVQLPDAFDGVRSAYVRIRLAPDEIYNGDGLYVDDFSVECTGTYGSGSFTYLSGTSMATPHVSGVAALVLARNPAYTTAQVRTKLLASVDTKSSLAGKVATGGRINAAKAVR